MTTWDDAKQIYRKHRKIPLVERAKRMIELAQRRAGNLDQREDARALAESEIRWWRLKLIKHFCKKHHRPC